jgi:prepilin-type N-terminal cleavage/methylation domain-containing protein
MKHTRGFTLIELLITLTIIAILVSIVVISLTTFIGKGEKEACGADQHLLQVAVAAFYSQGLEWPTGEDQVLPADIVWDDTDDYGDALVPEYLFEVPATDAKCDWQIDAHGRVVANGDECPCE